MARHGHSHAHHHHQGIGHHHIGHHSHHLTGFGRRRFGHSHGFGFHHSFRNHYYGSGGDISCCCDCCCDTSGIIFDGIAASPMHPTIVDGTYSIAGNQASVMTSLASFTFFYQEKVNLNQGQPVQLNAASVYIIGNKTHQQNSGCYAVTCLLGFCLVFPFFFMCCDWWKKIVYPQYQVSIEAYHSIAQFLANAPMINNLTLQVVDNAFNAQKATVLHQSLVGRQMVGFTFVNHATGMNYYEQEYDNFQTQVQLIKQLPFQTNLEWDDACA